LYFLSADLSIRITRPGEDITLERDGNGWVTMSCPTNDCSAAQKTHYHYDANGARVRKVRGIAGQERLYPWPWLEVHPDGSGLHELHYFAGSRRIATVRRSGNASAGTPGSYLSARYYHSDHVGSNTLVTRSDGSTVQESVLDPFGELLHQPLTSASNAYLFTDQERDEQTGLDYFGARYYDPWVGRFMSVDPESLGGVTFGRSLADTQQTNVYSYVRNSPTRLIDPTGRSVSCIIGCGSTIWSKDADGNISVIGHTDSSGNLTDGSTGTSVSATGLGGGSASSSTAAGASGSKGGSQTLARGRSRPRGPAQPRYDSRAVPPRYRPPGGGTTPGPPSNPVAATADAAEILQDLDQIVNSQMPGPNAAARAAMSKKVQESGLLF